MKLIKDINEINTSTSDGKLLIAALVILTTENRTNKTPYDVIEELNILVDKIGFEQTNVEKLTFEQELESVINRFSKENDSNTPDFILANYLSMCLDAFNKTSLEREKWYGKSLHI